MKPLASALALSLLASAAVGETVAVTNVNGTSADASGTVTMTTFLPVYDNTGAAKAPSHVVVGTCTLSVGACTVTLSGAAVFSSATSYTCTTSDQSLTAVLPSISNSSGTVFKIAGTLTDKVRYQCIGW